MFFILNIFKGFFFLFDLNWFEQYLPLLSVAMLPAYTIFELIPATPILKLYGLLLDKFVHVAYFVWLYTHYSKYLILLFIWSARKDSNLHMFPYKRNSLNRWRTCGYLSPDSLYDIWKTLDLTYNLSMTWLLRTRNLQLRNSQILPSKPEFRIVMRRWANSYWLSTPLPFLFTR